jgi:hypothetical protein
MSQVERRTFAAALGGLMLSPALLATATQEIQDTESISRQTLAAILELSGQTMTEEQMNRTRQALEMLIRDFEPIREFKMPPGVEPSTCFRAR